MGVSERWSRRRPMAKRKCEWYRVFTEFLPSFWFFSLSLSLHFCGRHRRIGFHLPFGAVVSLLIFEKEREREREMRRRRSAGRPLWRRGADADAAKKQRPPPYPPQQQQQKKNWKKIERERERMMKNKIEREKATLGRCFWQVDRRGTPGHKVQTPAPTSKSSQHRRHQLMRLRPCNLPWISLILFFIFFIFCLVSHFTDRRWWPAHRRAQTKTCRFIYALMHLCIYALMSIT